MKEEKRVVESIPVKVFLEISLDRKKASIVFKTEEGNEYILKQELNDEYRNLAVEEITED